MTLHEVRNIGEILATAAAINPTHHALRCRGEGQTYEQLDAHANRIAHILHAAGLTGGDRVALIGFKSFGMVAAMQGVLRADGVYVPLDPRAPAARLASVCADCGVRMAIVDAAGSRHSPDLARAGVEHFLDLDDRIAGDAAHVIRSTDIDRAPSTPHQMRRGGDDLAYVLYTSGSTGQPKGVMLSHENALTFVRWAARHFGFDDTDRILCHTPLTFDLPVCDLYNGFWARATVVLIPETDALFPVATVRTIENERITSVLAVPSSYVALINRGGLLSADASSIRRLMYSGEPFPVPQLRVLRAWASTQHICNLYGPIETNCCTYYCIGELPPEVRSVPLGKEMDNVRITIRGDDGRELGTGEEGEISIAGGCVMQGYWGDDVLTRAKRTFVDGAMHYATGDRGWRDAHGVLHFAGRRDRMVKSRGYRIELEEVEHAIAAHPGVVEAAVAAVPDAELGNVLYAWFVPDSSSVTADHVMQFAAKSLPAYMLPHALFALDELPKTGSGKISRRRLVETLAATAPIDRNDGGLVR